MITYLDLDSVSDHTALGVEQEPLALMVVNKLRGHLRVRPVNVHTLCIFELHVRVKWTFTAHQAVQHQVLSSSMHKCGQQPLSTVSWHALCAQCTFGKRGAQTQDTLAPVQHPAVMTIWLHTPVFGTQQTCTPGLVQTATNLKSQA